MRKAGISLLYAICGLAVCSHLASLLNVNRHKSFEETNPNQQCQLTPYSMNNKNYEEHPDDIAEQFHRTQQNEIVPSYTISNGTTPLDWLPSMSEDPNLYRQKPNLIYFYPSYTMPLG